ncbi:MAG: recombinase RecA [Myxococcota bacterium]|jgi:recombination protein RecA|nr:recombinase RecA [Myxococcota bacterium]
MKKPSVTDKLKSKLDSLKGVLDAIERQFGKGAVMRMDADATSDVQAIPTGCPSLDLALGIGGLPRGRVIEVFGPESSGKTTLALHAIAQVQQEGGLAAFIDAEHAFDVSYARRLGVQVERLLVSQPDCGEQALEIVELLIRSGSVDLVVVDSVAALVPRAEIEGEMGDSHVGLQARLMSQAMRKITGLAHRQSCSVFFINQLRQKIGVTFGNGETTTGGNALKFYASVRLDIRRIGAVKQGEQTIGNRTRVKVVKNKLAPPFAATEFDILYGEGISLEGDLLDTGLAMGLIQRSGAWYTHGERRLGQGREGARETLRSDPALRQELQERLRQGAALLVRKGRGGDAGGRSEEDDEPGPSPAGEEQQVA